MQVKPRVWIPATVLLFLVLSIGLRRSVAGVDVTPDRLIGLALIILSPLWFLSSRRIRSAPRFIDYLFFSWLVWMVGVSFALLPLSAAFKGVAVILLAAVFYLAPRYVALLSPGVLAHRRVSVPATVIFALGGIVSFALSDPLPRRAEFTVLEPNLYGAAMAFFCLLAIRNYDKRRRWLSAIVLVLAHLGLLLSFSRGPWLGYAVGLVAYVLLAKRQYLSLRSFTKKTAATAGTVVVACAVFLLVLGPLTHVFDYLSPPPTPRAQLTSAGGAQTAQAATTTTVTKKADAGLLKPNTVTFRFHVWRMALDDVASRPVTGLGALSFAHYHTDLQAQFNTTNPMAAWISNIVLGVLHDTGIIGLLLFLGFVLSLLVYGVRTAIGRGAYGADLAQGEAAAFWTSASLAFLVVSQTTSMISLGVLWLALGCLCCVLQAQARPGAEERKPAGRKTPGLGSAGSQR